MEHLGIRVSSELNSALASIADNEGVSKSDVCRYMLQECVDEFPDDEMPEHIRKNFERQKIVNENRWKIQCMTFKDRVRQFLDDQLERDFPPEPEKMRDKYIESAREEAIKFEDYKDEYLDFLAKEYERYKLLHPSSINDKKRMEKEDYDRAIKIIADNGAIGRWDMAAEYAERLEQQDRLPASKSVEDLMQEARDMNRGDWREEWTRSIRSNWPDIEEDTDSEGE